jgi:hypothetical protein
LILVDHCVLKKKMVGFSLMFVSNIEGLSYDNGRMVPLPKSLAPLESFMISF